MCVRVCIVRACVRVSWRLFCKKNELIKVTSERWFVSVFYIINIFTLTARVKVVVLMILCLNYKMVIMAHGILFLNKWVLSSPCGFI